MRTRGKRATPRSTQKDEPAVKRTLGDLLNIMAKLRGPSGCPWDREQTGHRSGTVPKMLRREKGERDISRGNNPPSSSSRLLLTPSP